MNADTLRGATLILCALATLLNAVYSGGLWPLRGASPPKPRFAKITGILYVCVLYAASSVPAFLALTIEEATLLSLWYITMAWLGCTATGLAWVLRKSQPLLFWMSVTATAAPIGFLLGLARAYTGNDLLLYPGCVLVVAPLIVLISALRKELKK